MESIGVTRLIRLGAGAGFSGDRIDPALDLVERGQLDYLVFECLAERTIALAQAARQSDPKAGFDPLLERRMRVVLAPAFARQVRIVTNMGAANPVSAAITVRRIAAELGLTGLKVVAVVGDDVLGLVKSADLPLASPVGGNISDLGDKLLSANAYLGAKPIAAALAAGAHVVVTGRVCDPALFLGPLIHEFGWDTANLDLLAAGTCVGHLLECAGQLTGGYFAVPGIKDVPDLARLGFPFADVAADGSAVLGKLAGTGGALTVANVAEQLLYEVLDPSAYQQADVTSDFSGVSLGQTGPDQVSVAGAKGKPAPSTLKVSVGYHDGYIGEGQISYAGANAVARARLALEIVEERLRLTEVEVRELRGDLIGLNSCNRTAAMLSEPAEVRLRVVARCAGREAASAVGAEVEALYTNGPSGGGGVTKDVREVIAIASTFLPRASVPFSLVEETV